MTISLQHFTKMYGEQKAVDNISFDIKKGEVVGFLGPNGAGKSTTMKFLTGYIDATEGSATICGMEHNKENSIAIKRRIGYLPESNPHYSEMYVKEYLTFLAEVHQIPSSEINEAVDQMIEQIGLKQEMHKKIGNLSKGYKQRVGLVQAMIHKPDIMILDEPTSGLDPNQIVDIRGLIKSYGKDKTILLSTHIMQEVEAMCDRVIIINRGKIVADESLDTLRAQYPTLNLEEVFRTLTQAPAQEA
ncbi:MAG: ATP-binding cassette domain-containing protein [Chitinophagaceae bacterium]